MEEAIETSALEIEKRCAQGVLRKIGKFFLGRPLGENGRLRLYDFEFVKNVEAATGWKREDLGGDFVRRIAFYFCAALDAESLAAASVEQAEVIVNFGGGGDGGTRVSRDVFLANGYGGSDAGDFVDVGLFHALEELASVSREGFDVAALAFGVDGVKGEGRFAGAAHSCDDGDFVVRDVHADGFEIVRACATDAERFGLREGGGGVRRDEFVSGQGRA